MTRVYYKEAVGCILVFDVTRPASFEAVSKWKTDLDSKVQLPNGGKIPCVLLGNKVQKPITGLFHVLSWFYRYLITVLSQPEQSPITVLLQPCHSPITVLLLFSYDYCMFDQLFNDKYEKTKNEAAVHLSHYLCLKQYKRTSIVDQ